MGPIVVIRRLVIGDIARRRVQSLLLAVMILATCTTLTLGLALGAVSENPFALTRAATLGPDVVVQSGFAPGARAPSPHDFAAVVHAPGVRATAGPYPVASVRLTKARVNVPVEAIGRDQAPAAIDRPRVVSGGWLRPGAIVLERGLAGTLGIDVGAKLKLAGRAFTVSGIAVSTAQPYYPAQVPGVVWMARADVARLATPATPLSYTLDIRLERPDAADAFFGSAAVNAFAQQGIRANRPALFTPWSFVRHDDYRLIALDRRVMTVGGWLLALLALASTAVLVGGRMAEQTRRVGLLKAVGATPGLVAAVLLTETTLLALAGAIAGLIAGDLLAPSLADPAQGLLGHASVPHIAPGEALVVVLLGVGVAAAATIVPAVRGARASTIAALTESVQPHRRRRWLVARSASLPAPLLLAFRLVARRTRRTVLTGAGLVVAVATAVTALTVQHDLQLTQSGPSSAGLFTRSAVTSQANHVLVMLSVVLAILAAITTAFTAWATVVDAQRATALARALGATPRQVSGGLTVAQVLPALVAACIGIPAGLLLYQAAGGDLSEAKPPVLWLLAVIPLTLFAVAAVTAVPARIGARRPVAEVLRAD